MKKIVLFIYLGITVNLVAFSQNDLLALNSTKTTFEKEDENDEDYWETELSPLTHHIEILNFIYRDPYKIHYSNFIPAGYPLRKEIDITSFYGARNHPVHHVMKFHRGIDLKGSTGEVAIATGDGVVIDAGFRTDLGNFVKIKHKYGFETIYGHLSAIKVKKGTKICKNQIVGLVGATGTVTGPHLHYTLKKNGEYMDPFDFLFMDFKEENN